MLEKAKQIWVWLTFRTSSPTSQNLTVPTVRPVTSRLIDGKLFLVLTVALLILILPSLFGLEMIAQVASLHSLSLNENPYIQLNHAPLLYFVTPLTTVSIFILFLTPGLLFILATNQAENILEWPLLGFAVSLVLVAVLSTIAKLLFGTPVALNTMLICWLSTTLLAWFIISFRLSRGDLIRWFDNTRSGYRQLGAVIGVMFLIIVTLFPKLFWENFNIDGIEAFEFGRSLSRHWMVHGNIGSGGSGTFGFFHNLVLFSFPNHWFITLVGQIEAAARLPFVMYIGLLFLSLLLVIEKGGRRTLKFPEHIILWLGLITFVVVQTYNTSYEPYFGDIAEPAATDSLWMLCYITAVYFLFSDRFGWFIIFGLMTNAASPGGLPLIGALAVPIFFSKSPNRYNQLRMVVILILACILIGIANEIYNRWILEGVNNQFSAKNSLRRLFPPTLTEFNRLNALIFPSGILPAITLLFLRRKDIISWTVTGVTLLYFGLIYIQVWTSMHQFTPVMLLPLIVFWRLYLDASRAWQRLLLPLLAVTTAVSLYLSLPPHFTINQSIRKFGEASEYKIGDYENAYVEAVRGGESWFSLVPEDYRLEYPNQPWGADFTSLIYYATRDKRENIIINYIIQPLDDPPVENATLVDTRDNIAIYVVDKAVWQRDLAQDLPKIAQSPIYAPILLRTLAFFYSYAQKVQAASQQIDEHKNQ